MAKVFTVFFILIVLVLGLVGWYFLEMYQEKAPMAATRSIDIDDVTIADIAARPMVYHAQSQTRSKTFAQWLNEKISYFTK